MPADVCYLGDYVALVRLKTGHKMYVDTRDTIVTPHLLLDGEWEKWVTDMIWRYLKPGDTFVDVGAHVGWYTLLAAERVGPKGRVVSFEPNPGLYRMLRDSVHINGFQNHTDVRQQAALDVDGSVQLRWDLTRTGWGHVVSADVPVTTEKSRGAYQIASVTAVKLASVLETASMIKIDAEHSELAVLRGALPLIERSRPILIVEHHPLPPEVPYTELVWLVEHGGYGLFFIKHDATLQRLTFGESSDGVVSINDVGDGEMLLLNPKAAP